MGFILACGICVAGLGMAVFPPVIWWAAIASIWFVSVSIVRSRFNLPNRLIPGPLVSILLLLLISVLGFTLAGPTLHLFLLPLCLLTTSINLPNGREVELRGLQAIRFLAMVAVVSLILSAGVEYFRISRMTAE